MTVWLFLKLICILVTGVECCSVPTYFIPFNEQIVLYCFVLAN